MELRQGAVESVEMNPEFWRKKKVLITGHTGFKGSWLSLWLQSLGAQVTGYSLVPPTQPSLFVLADVEKGMESLDGNILDLERLRSVVRDCQPEIVFHLAAQSLVRQSYLDPVGTYATNVLGTAHLLEVLRSLRTIKAAVIVTSDKCYENQLDSRSYVETDGLGGSDPYSSSKACAELVTAAFRKSFFAASGNTFKFGVGSARAGNVIGGGDWAADRLIPDVVRAVSEGKQLLIRNPDAVRPWQHVLDPLCGYLTLAERLCEDPDRYSDGWNFGPNDSEVVPVSTLLERFSQIWGPGIRWCVDTALHPHEARHLRLDCSKAKAELGWQPLWNLGSSLEATVKWYKAYQTYRVQRDLRSLVFEQIQTYLSLLTQPAIS